MRAWEVRSLGAKTRRSDECLEHAQERRWGHAQPGSHVTQGADMRDREFRDNDFTSLTSSFGGKGGVRGQKEMSHFE